MKVVANTTKDIRRFYGRTGYQIVVDRFYRAGNMPIPNIPGRILKNWDDSKPNWWPDEKGEFKNDYFYGGDLKGVKAKLDYIQQLGFDFIYIGPITKFGEYHHYDVHEHMEIDPYIGKWDDVEELCTEAHKRDMLVMIDFVSNHMGAGSYYFQDAINNPNSKYRDWFEFKNGQPVFWYGFKNMPQGNKSNKEYIQKIKESLRNYCSRGVDQCHQFKKQIIFKNMSI